MLLYKKIVAHDFRYDSRILLDMSTQPKTLHLRYPPHTEIRSYAFKNSRSLDSAVGTETASWTVRLSIPGTLREFMVTAMSRPAPEPIKPSIQNIPRLLTG